MARHDGSCHCGAVRFVVDVDIAQLTTCDCSLCVKKNALMTRVHESAMTILAGEDVLSLYQWNTKRAKHYFCSRCGIYTFHRKRAMPDHYEVNVRCLDGFDASTVPVRGVDGVGMSVVEDGARTQWPGPREAG
jgi:hypothetical protein